jgi:hypothetical protein
MPARRARARPAGETKGITEGKGAREHTDGHRTTPHTHTTQANATRTGTSAQVKLVVMVMAVVVVVVAAAAAAAAAVAAAVVWWWCLWPSRANARTHR